MEYFSAQQARLIIYKSPLDLCVNSATNPNREAFSALLDLARERADCPLMAAVSGFLLGRAIGIREERSRRKGGRGA